MALLEAVAGNVTVLIPGHGSVGDADDPRLTTGPHKEWLPDIHDWQARQITEKSMNGKTTAQG
ncbi:MAG TPA: hypothetical protein VJM32_01300 [Candidatus Saccharimonadales bacterium]|nr:hypothetical protein [Candidatus Saccharimonadales bacterium]